MSKRGFFFIAAFVLFSLGCGGFRIDVPTVAPRAGSPLATAPASAVQIVLSPEMAQDKVAMLQRHRVLETIQERVTQGLAQIPSGDRVRIGEQIRDASLAHHLTAAHSGARPEVDDVISAFDRVFVVFDDHQGVLVGGQFRQSIEQDAIVARV